MICAVAAAVCSCDKYGDTIDELNKKLDGVEATQAELLNKVEAMQALANAKAAETTISSIATTADGLKVCFSDGKQFIIADGANGKDGAKGQDGANGEDKIKVTEDATSYTFDFGNGDVITVAKTFTISIEEDSIEAPAGSDVAIKYEIVGGDETVKVAVKALDGCKIVGIDEEACQINVLAAGRQGEHTITISAIRNSDGKVAEKFVTIVSGPRAPIALEGAMCGDYGDYAGNGTNDWFTQFYKGEIDENNYFVGEAYSLLFDFYGPASDVLSALPAGDYVAADEMSIAEFTYLIGTEATLYDELVENFWLYQLFFGYNTIEELIADMGYTDDELYTPSYVGGAELYHQYDDETAEDRAITDGTVSIAVSGNTYTVTMNIVACDEEWIFTYEGEIELEDHRPKPAEFVATASNWGDDLAENTTDWWIQIKDKNHPENGTYFITLLGPANGTELPTGTFEVKDDYSVNSVVPGEDYTWYYYHDMCWDEASEGTLTIENNGSTWTIYGEFYDAHYDEDWVIDYEGALEYDISNAFEAPARGGHLTPELGNTPEVRTSPRLMREQVNAYKAIKTRGGRTPWFNHR